MFVRVAIALFGLSFFALGAFFQKHESETRKDLAIIIVPENEVKKAPGLGTEKVSSVFGGVKILILRELGEWSLVQLPNGEKGWIEKKCFEII